MYQHDYRVLNQNWVFLVCFLFWFKLLIKISYFPFIIKDWIEFTGISFSDSQIISKFLIKLSISIFVQVYNLNGSNSKKDKVNIDYLLKFIIW